MSLSVLTLRPSRPDLGGKHLLADIFSPQPEVLCTMWINTGTLVYFYLLGVWSLMKSSQRSSCCWPGSRIVTQTLHGCMEPRKCPNQGTIVYIYVILHCWVKTWYSVRLLLSHCSWGQVRAWLMVSTPNCLLGLGSAFFLNSGCIFFYYRLTKLWLVYKGG